MSVIAFFAFGGAKPGIAPKLLPENAASYAEDCSLETGDIRPFFNTEEITDLAKTGEVKTIFRIADSIWLEWNEEVNVARMPIARNVYNRVAFTGTDKPRFTDIALAASGGSYQLGLPTPEDVLSVRVLTDPPDGVQLSWDIAGTATDTVGDRIAKVYTFTYVNGYGEEGPPADPSLIVYSNDDEYIELTNFGSGPTVDDSDIQKIRIYRALAATATQASYLLVDEITAEAGAVTVVEGNVTAPDTYQDRKSDAELGEALETATWSTPPSGLRGVTAMANGILAAYIDNTIYFSEPYQGHAWPEDYQRSVDFPILGLASAGNMLFVMTEGYPYIVVGNHPDVLSVTKLERTQACVSGRSIVDMGTGVIYASTDGLVNVSTSGEAALLTDGVFLAVISSC